MLVRLATREEELYTRTDCRVLLEGAVLGVDITTRSRHASLGGQR